MKNLLRRFAKTSNKHCEPDKNVQPAARHPLELQKLEELGEALVEMMKQETCQFDQLTCHFFASEESRKPQAASTFLTKHWDMRQQHCYDIVQEYMNQMGEECKSAWQKALSNHGEVLSPAQMLYFVFGDKEARKILHTTCEKFRSQSDEWWKRFMQEGAQRWKPIRVLEEFQSAYDHIAYDEEFNVFVRVTYIDKYGPQRFNYYFAAISPQEVKAMLGHTFKNYPAQVPSQAIEHYFFETDNAYCAETDRSFLSYIQQRLQW